MSTYTKDQAKASDRVLADAQKVVYQLAARVSSTVDRIHRATGDDYKKKYSAKSGWKLTDKEAFDQAIELAKTADNDYGYDAPSKAKLAIQSYREIKVELNAAQATLRNQEQVWFENGRWSRFFLVTGGHIHNSTHCHTLYPTTQIGWLPELSGETEQDAVNAHGALLCTICFPSAPVEWTDGRKADDDTKCTSQKLVPGSLKERYRSAYGVCADCGASVTLTSTYRVRKHKKGS